MRIWLARGGGGGNVASHRDNYRVLWKFQDASVCIVREGRSPGDGSRSSSFSSTEVNPSITRKEKKVVADEIPPADGPLQ